MRYAELAEKLGLTPQQIAQYLRVIRQRYPPPIVRVVEEVLATPPRDAQILQTLKQEVRGQKPPYKTIALQKHKTPEQTVKQAQKTQPPPRLEWKTKHLGGKVLGVAWSPNGQKLAAGTK